MLIESIDVKDRERSKIMPHRDISSTTRVIKKQLESLGYRVCIACDHDRWICTAKDDDSGQFCVVKADTENQAIAELAELVGIDLADG